MVVETNAAADGDNSVNNSELSQEFDALNNPNRENAHIIVKALKTEVYKKFMEYNPELATKTTEILLRYQDELDSAEVQIDTIADYDSFDIRNYLYEPINLSK
jgi:hypothetical protein